MEKKIEEQIDVSIKEDKIKEKSFILNLQEGKINYLSDIIEGELKGIIIDSENYCNIRISLEQYDSVVLFEKQGFYGQKNLEILEHILAII